MDALVGLVHDDAAAGLGAEARGRERREERRGDFRKVQRAEALPS
jgi:hypothetical protein